MTDYPNPKKRKNTGLVNHVKNKIDEDLLVPYTIAGKINGPSILILRDTGTIVDGWSVLEICFTPKNDREHVWV